MHAVVVRVSIDAERGDEALKNLNETVLPMARQSPGFKAGYWTRSPDGSKGCSMEIFESEKDAQAFSENLKMPPGAPTTLESIELMEVVGSA
ncbi:MAG: hypothetical protein QOC92_3639 [Acidimicrobiaceae bacterium]